MSQHLGTAVLPQHPSQNAGLYVIPSDAHTCLSRLGQARLFAPALICADFLLPGLLFPLLIAPVQCYLMLQKLVLFSLP